MGKEKRKKNERKTKEKQKKNKRKTKEKQKMNFKMDNDFRKEEVDIDKEVRGVIYKLRIVYKGEGDQPWCKLRPLDQIRPKFGLKSDLYHLLINIFDTNSWILIKLSRQICLFRIQIRLKSVKSMERD